MATAQPENLNNSGNTPTPSGERPNILRRILQQFTRPKTTSVKTDQEKQSWEERKARADGLIEQIERVQRDTNHPAREFLNGVQFDAKTLAHYPSLMVTISNIVNVDPHRDLNNQDNSLRWLASQTSELESWMGVLADNPTDYQYVGMISGRLKGKIRQVLGGGEEGELAYRKVIDSINERAKYLKQGGVSETEEEEARQEKTRREAEDLNRGVTWIDAVDEDGRRLDLPTEIITQNRSGQQVNPPTTPVTGVVTRIKEGIAANHDFSAEDIEVLYEDLEKGYKTLRKQLVQQGVDGGEAREQIEELHRQMLPFEVKLRGKLRELGVGKELRKGRFYRVIEEDPALEKDIKSNYETMDTWFYKIMDALLNDKSHVEHRELFGLYPSSDMDSFLEIVGQIPKTGPAWVDHYRVLLESIKQLHDQDYYAVHSSGDVKSFVQGAALLRNSYITSALAHPGVALAWRAYENALTMIRDSNRGYMPPELISYSEATGTSVWDDISERLFMDAVRNGLVRERARGTDGFYMHGSDRKPVYDRVLTEQDFEGEYGILRLHAIMKMAKGLGIASMRNLEIFGRSKGPGSSHPEFGADPGEGAFHSIPYEGIARWMEPFVHWFAKYNQGHSRTHAILSMMITGDPRKIPSNKEAIKEMYVAAREGRLGDVMEKYTGKRDDQRLIALENMFSFSGFFGTMSKWRVVDSIIGFDDWEKGYMGGAIRLSLNRSWAEGKVSGFQGKIGGADFIAIQRKYKEQYKQALLSSGNQLYVDVANNPDQFEVWWEKKGRKDIYKYQIAKEEAELKKNKKASEELKALTDKLTTAMNTRTWIQMAMRNPMTVAKIINEGGLTHAGQKTIAERPLRQRIIREILGIDLDADLTSYRTLNEFQEQNLKQVARLEGALFAVQQRAVQENRDLTDADFDTIGDPTLQTQAKLYWQKVKNQILGENRTAEDWYQAIGLTGGMREARNLEIDWEKIQNNQWNDLFKERGSILDTSLVDKQWRYLFSTDDVAWDKFDLDNLGERHAFRRAGDFGSHQEGVNLTTDYMNNNMIWRPDKKDLVEQLTKICYAFRGSDINVGYDVTGWLSYLTVMMYKNDDWIKIPVLGPLLGMGIKHSVMQELVGGVTLADAWGANDTNEFLKMVQGKDILPPKEIDPLTGGPYQISSINRYDFQKLQKMLGSTDADILYEILSLGIPIAMVLTAISSATKKSEEDEK